MSGRYTYAFAEDVREAALPVALLLDRLVPGVSYAPRPPTILGLTNEEVYAGRHRALYARKWVPRTVSAPGHATGLLERWAGSAGIRFERVESILPPAKDEALARWEPPRLLGRLESEPLTFYQKACYNLADENPLLQWAPGCLSGDTEIVVNRGGAARRMTLRDFVFKFNGGVQAGSGYRKWRVDAGYPTCIPSLADDGFMRKNPCVAAVFSGIKPVWRVRTIEGHEIKATADHKFKTADGWRALSELAPGSAVAINFRPKSRGKDVPSATTEKAYYPETGAMQHHPFHVARDAARTRELALAGGGVSIYKDRHRAWVVPTHRLVAEARENGLTLDDFVLRVRAGVIDGLTFLDPAVWQVHHKDRDTTNYEPANLEVLSTVEHLRLHGKEGGWQHCAFRAKYVAVESVKFVGEEETFDLTMTDPLNNFVANDFVVHNSGKSRGVCIYAACRPGPVVWITPSQAKTTIDQQVRRYFPAADPFVWTAPSLRRARDRTYEQWLKACYGSGEIPVLIVGHETFPDAWRAGDVRSIVAGWNGESWLRRYGFRGGWVTVAFDESHRFKSHKRYTSAVMSDGTLKFRGATTKSGELPLSVALAESSRWAARRIALSATPIANKVEQLWVQLDLLEPGSFGTWSTFALRYAGMIAGDGGIEPMALSKDEPPPNSDELRERLTSIFYHVTYQESHGALPAKRRQTTYLTPQEQLKELGGDWVGFLKNAAKKGPSHLLEARLMQAASKKRGWVTRRVLDFVGEGTELAPDVRGKVLVLTGRRRDADTLGRVLAGKVPTGVRVWTGHGGIERAERDAMIAAYMASPGPCVLVGTIDSFGIAVNLQDTDLLIFAMLPATWDALWQAENRVSRLGMTRPVLVEFPIAENTVDEQVASAFLEKLPAIGALTADVEVSEVGESLAGLSDPEALMDSILSKILSSDIEATA